MTETTEIRLIPTPDSYKATDRTYVGADILKNRKLKLSRCAEALRGKSAWGLGTWLGEEGMLLRAGRVLPDSMCHSELTPLLARENARGHYLTLGSQNRKQKRFFFSNTCPLQPVVHS